MTEQPGQPGESPEAPAARQCPWCAAPAKPDDVTCSACGAALAQRESIGDVRIPGLTSVDPALEDFDKRPIHLRGPSPSQGVAPALIIGAVAGGPIGLVAIGGVAAVAGAEFLASHHGGPGGPNLEDVGKPSEVLLQALEHLDGNPPDPSAPPEPGPDVASNATVDDGRSIWRDLPSVAPAFEPAEAVAQHEEDGADGR
jgi:hypothetical protein